MTQEKIHFIGGGQMAEAIIRACISNNTLSVDQVSISDINEARLQFLSTKYGIDTKSSQEQSLSTLQI